MLKNLMSTRNMQMALIAILLIVVAWWCTRKSSMMLSPGAVELDEKESRDSADGIFKLPYQMDCTPGPSENASYYSKDLTPGGICGAQDWVNDQMRYKIKSTSGDSLLD